MGRFGEALTPTEELIARHISCGLKNKEIAERIRRSDSSVKNQVASIFVKLGVKNRASVAAHFAKVGE